MFTSYVVIDVKRLIIKLVIILSFSNVSIVCFISHMLEVSAVLPWSFFTSQSHLLPIYLYNVMDLTQLLMLVSNIRRFLQQHFSSFSQAYPLYSGLECPERRL